MFIDGIEYKSVDQVKRLKDILDESQDEKIIRCAGGKAQLMVTQNNVIMSNESNYVNVNQFGTTIDGKVHLAAEPSKIRINGFWVLNDELLTTLPSTIYTPIPVLVYDESPAVKNIQAMTKFLLGLG